MSTHSTGPFTFEGSFIHGANERFIAVLKDVPEVKSNGLLFAAAPDLLAALQAMLHADDCICENIGSKSDQTMIRIAALDSARAAIALAAQP